LVARFASRDKLYFNITTLSCSKCIGAGAFSSWESISGKAKSGGKAALNRGSSIATGIGDGKNFTTAAAGCDTTEGEGITIR
jgi:hypothetical protein